MTQVTKKRATVKAGRKAALIEGKAQREAKRTSKAAKLANEAAKLAAGGAA